MAEWKPYSIVSRTERPVFREGWPGVWDALIRAVKGRHIHYEEYELTISFQFLTDIETKGMTAEFARVSAIENPGNEDA